MHVLDSVMTSVDIADVVSVVKSDDISVTFSDDFSGECSNAYKAARLMKTEYNLGGAEIYVERVIPIGAGLGSSSADAAAVIFAMNKLYAIDRPIEELRTLAAKIGSDVPFMLTGGCARLTGTGAEINPIEAQAHGKILLCGRGAVDTAECFRLFDKRGSVGFAARTDELINALKNGDLSGAVRLTGNALYSAAVELNADVKKIVEVMDRAGLAACMTGSGAYVFGTGSETEIANAALNLKRHGYSPIMTKTSENGIEQII